MHTIQENTIVMEMSLFLIILLHCCRIYYHTVPHSNMLTPIIRKMKRKNVQWNGAIALQCHELTLPLQHLVTLQRWK